MMEKLLTEGQTAVGTPCRHYWVIEPAAGPVSRGVCRHCGEEREFKNYLVGPSWDEEVRLADVSRRGSWPLSLPGDSKESDE